MAVVIETTLGDMTVDLFTEERPTTCLNFLKLCKVKYFNFCLFHSVQHNFIAQTGDPTGSGNGGESIFAQIQGNDSRFYEAEMMPKLKHYKPGLVSMVNCGNNMLGSQFFVTLGGDLQSLDNEHCIFGEVSEGFEVLQKLNEAICDTTHRPYQDIRITHTVILEDPFDDPPGLQVPSCSPELTQEMLKNGRIAPDEVIDETAGLSIAEVEEIQRAKEAAAQATILEIVGDLPDADVAPPENVLFVCKLNPVTTDDDLEVIFSRFGKVKSCEVIRDKKTGDSLQYAFVEFEDAKACELAYFKMDNVLIDDRRIHVDFSQSVSKLRWKGKGRGVEHLDDSATGKGENDSISSGRRNYNSTGPKTDEIKVSLNQASKKGSNGRDHESNRSYSYRSSSGSRRDRNDDRRRRETSLERDRSSHSSSRREDSGERKDYSYSRDRRDRRDKDRRGNSHKRDDREDKRRRDDGSGDRGRREDSSRIDDDRVRREDVRYSTETEREYDKYSSRSKRDDRRVAELKEPERKIVYEYKSDVKSDETQSEGLNNEKVPEKNENVDRSNQKNESKETHGAERDHSSEQEEHSGSRSSLVVSGEREEKYEKEKSKNYESKEKDMHDKFDKDQDEAALLSSREVKEKKPTISETVKETIVNDALGKHCEETKILRDAAQSPVDVERDRQKGSSERTKNVSRTKAFEETGKKHRHITSESSDENQKKKRKKSKKEMINDVKKVKKHDKTKKEKEVESESSDDHKSSKKRPDLEKSDKNVGVDKSKSRSSSKSVEKKIKKSSVPSSRKEKRKDRDKRVAAVRKKKKRKTYTSSSSEDDDSSSSSESSSDSESDSSDSDDKKKKKKRSKRTSVIAKKVKKRVKAKQSAKKHHRSKLSSDSDSGSSDHSHVKKKKVLRKKSSVSGSSVSDSSDSQVETKKKRKRKRDSSVDDRMSKKSKLEKKKKSIKRKRKASSSSEYSSTSSDSSSDSDDYRHNKKRGRTGDKKTKKVRK